MANRAAPSSPTTPLPPPRVTRRQSSSRLIPLSLQSQQPTSDHCSPPTPPLPAALDDEPPRKRGLFGSRKSFSGIRGHSHLSDIKHGFHQAAANVKSALHKDRAGPTGESDLSDDSRPRRQPVRRRSTTLLLSRPWTSHPFGGFVKESSLSPARPETQRSKEPSFLHMDPSQGAAARQFARDYGKVPNHCLPVINPSSPDDSFWVHHNRDRESGVSLSMDMDALELATNSTSSPHEPRSHLVDPFSFLPQELASSILSCLSIEDVLRAQRVSRLWQGLSKDLVLRRNIFLQQWANTKHADVLPAPVGGKGLGKKQEIDQKWAAMYHARQLLSERWAKGPRASNVTAIYLNGHQDSVYCVQFDERYVITGSRDRTIRVWDVRDGRLLRVIGIPQAFQNDQTEASIVGTQSTISGDNITVSNPIPSTQDHNMYHVPTFYHNASILCLQFDSEILVTGSSDCSLIVWDMQTWQPIRSLREHRAGVLDIAFDNEKIVSCSKDGTICVWDRSTGRLLAKLTGHRGPVNAVQMRNDRVVSASGEGCAKLWELRVMDAGHPTARCEFRCIRDFWSRDKGLACVEFSADGMFVLAGGNDQVIYKFATASGHLVDVLEGHNQLVRSLYLDGVNGRVISGSYDLDLRCWSYDSTNGTSEMWCLEGWSSSWILSAKSDYRRLVSTSQDGRAMIIDFGAGIPGIDLLEA